MQEAGAMKSWLPCDNGFPLQNIPFGTFKSNQAGDIHCATRIGDFVIDLAILEKAGLFSDKFNQLKAAANKKNVFENEFINQFMSLGRAAWHQARVSIQKLFSHESPNSLTEQLKKDALHNVKDVQLTIPIKIGDYTDFYSSKNHAFNIGSIIRGPDNALQDNWSHLPVGYHGRASTIVVDGHEVRRPKGQVRTPGEKNPHWTDCKRMDFELEMGAIVGKSNPIGKPIKVKEADDYIFGLCLLNDWSARDIQVWEYVPLGPFNAKNFITTISPWIITMEALQPFKIKLPDQDPKPLPYLDQGENHCSYNIEMLVDLQTHQNPGKVHTIAKSNFKHLYWSVNQQLTHHSVTGCNMNVGDLLGSGTISGTQVSEYGSMLELSWAGKKPLNLQSGEKRVFLQDGDTVNLRGVCKGEGYYIEFGNCSGKLLPCLEDSQYF